MKTLTNKELVTIKVTADTKQWIDKYRGNFSPEQFLDIIFRKMGSSIEGDCKNGGEIPNPYFLGNPWAANNKIWTSDEISLVEVTNG